MALPDKPDLTFDAPFDAPPDVAEVGAHALTERDRAILAFERLWWKSPGAKEAQVWQDFGLSPARYYQVLGALLDLPAALEFDPMLVRRLRRLRHASPRARFPRRLDAGRT